MYKTINLYHDLTFQFILIILFHSDHKFYHDFSYQCPNLILFNSHFEYFNLEIKY